MFTERCGTGTWRGEEFMQHWPRFVEGGQILGLAIATTDAEMTRTILGLANPFLMKVPRVALVAKVGHWSQRVDRYRFIVPLIQCADAVPRSRLSLLDARMPSAKGASLDNLPVAVL